MIAWKQESASSAGEAKRGAEARDLPARSRGFASAKAGWSWVEASVWTDRMVSALVNGVTGGRWYSLMDKVYAPATLMAAWTKVRANKGAAGVDGQSLERFAARSDDYLAELASALREDSYRAQPIRRVEIPKGDGKTRPLGIPVVKSLPRARSGDRIAQTALKLVIEPIFEAAFHPSSYGFRPGRRCRDALKEVDGLIKEGHAFVVDADIEGYFDSIPRPGLDPGAADGAGRGTDQ